MSRETNVDRKRHRVDLPAMHRDALRSREQLSRILDSCGCTWPLERHATDTEHHDECPARLMIHAQRARAMDPDAAVNVVHVHEYAPGHCPSCDLIAAMRGETHA